MLKHLLWLPCTALLLAGNAAATQAPDSTPRPVYASEQARIDALKSLVDAAGFSLAERRIDVIEGRQTLMISKGVWDDSEVASYRLAHGSLPLALPLTRPMPVIDDNASDPNTEAPAWEREDSLETYYLYILLPPGNTESDSIRARLAGLLDESFQATLEQNSFQRLPAELLQAWKVNLGVSEPEFTGGYR